MPDSLYTRHIATAKAVGTETFLVGREAPHQKCPKQAVASYTCLKILYQDL